MRAPADDDHPGQVCGNEQADGEQQAGVDVPPGRQNALNRGWRCHPLFSHGSRKVKPSDPTGGGLPPRWRLRAVSPATQTCERVRAAVRNSGFVFPMKRITVNLAPAGL